MPTPLGLPMRQHPGANSSAGLVFGSATGQPPSLLTPTPPPSNRKALLLCLLITASFYPTPAFILMRLLNCRDSNAPSLLGQPPSGNVVLPGPFPGKEVKASSSSVPSKGHPLDGIKLVPASCHLQPIRATHRGRVTVPWGAGDSLSKKFNCVSGLWPYFVFVFSLKINSPWLELSFFFFFNEGKPNTFIGDKAK